MKPISIRSAGIGVGPLAAAMLTVMSGATHASTCPFDGGGGGSDALNDGVVLTRYALGITGAPMIASTRYASLDPLQVKNNIECVGCALDMNGDGQIDTVDTTIIARHLAGFNGASLTGGLALGAGSRNTTAPVTSFLVNGCAVGGAINAFVQGGNAFRAPGVLGTLDAQPLTVKSGGSAINLVNQMGDGLRISSSASATAPNTINGRNSNAVSAGVNGATIGGGGDTGGYANVVSGYLGTVAGGGSNTADTFSVVGGGTKNRASNTGSVVSGGTANAATGLFSTVAGGSFNIAGGDFSTIAGGTENIATGTYSFAAGYFAHADKYGTFVWADASTSKPFKVTTNWTQPTYGANTFNVRANGGVMFATSVYAPSDTIPPGNSVGSPRSYCYMGNSGTGWICASDRNVKERIEPIAPSRVLAGVLAMPVSTWSIIGSKVRQMGPMAQDFYRAFGLGDTDKAINSIDVGGVAFAAIQGLHELLKDKDAKIAALGKANAAMQRDVALMM